MIRHLFKLIWNRKRASALVIAEIFVCFLVLFAVLTLSIYTYENYQRPIGFAYRNVFSIDVTFVESRGDGGNTSRTGPASGAEPVVENPYEARQRSLLQLVKSDPAVLNAAWAAPLPFSQSNETRRYNFKKRPIRYSLARCTDEYKDVMGLEITRGRWFSTEDDGGGYEAVVISEALAAHAFGDEDPVGQSITADRTEGETSPEIERRVVGVMKALRQNGETDTEERYALTRLEYPSARMRRMDSMALLMKPGADANVEARLVATLLAAAPDWSFKVEQMPASAEFTRQIYMAPIGVAAVVAGFLVLMVALGLSGVLWQSVTTRIREIGVRRALGASAVNVKWQVIGELMVMATIAMSLGIVVVLQFPFLDLLGPVPPSVFAAGLSLTIVALYGLALVCGLHPARLATTVHPSEALRYE